MDTVERYVDSNGKECIKGSTFLKGTQAYTRDFGQAILRGGSNGPNYDQQYVADATT